MNDNAAQKILDFWFGNLPADEDALTQAKLWWGKDSSVDQYITQHFKEDYFNAIEGRYDHGLSQPKKALAFIVLLDQFSRHIFRNTPQAYSADILALSVTYNGIQLKQDTFLSAFERAFFYMPLEHSENIADQEKSVELFLALYENCSAAQKATFKIYYDCAIQHCDIIKRFGRFPHRNKILQRHSTPEEIEFLAGPNSSF